MLNVVLIEPEIPPNTGNIGRLCLSTGARLHLVGPLGFSLEDKALKRAGLDYWKDVDLHRWDSFEQVKEAADAQSAFYFLTTKTNRSYWDACYSANDYIVFGAETRGLPETLLEENEILTQSLSVVRSEFHNVNTDLNQICEARDPDG